MPITPDNPRWNNLGYWTHDAAGLHPDNIAIIDLSRDQPLVVLYREL